MTNFYTNGRINADFVGHSGLVQESLKAMWGRLDKYRAS